MISLLQRPFCTFCCSWLALPLLTFGNLVLAQVYPISLTSLLDVPINCVGAVSLYMYAFGYVKQHPVNRYNSKIKFVIHSQFIKLEPLCITLFFMKKLLLKCWQPVNVITDHLGAFILITLSE